MTEWRNIPDFPNYHVNDLGQVFSKRSKRELVGSLQKNSRTFVILRRDGENYKKYIHDLIAEAFLPPQPGPEYWVEHIDGDKFNLTPENLAWVKEGPSKYRTKNRKLMIVETEDVFKNAAECARFLDVSPMAISKHLNGTLKNVKGLQIVYIN